MNTTKHVIGWIALAGLLLAACQPLTDAGQAQLQVTVTPLPTAPAAQRTTFTVEQGDVRDEFTFRGRWLPRDQQALSFEVGGTLRNVAVRRGDTVQSGALLADLQIDDLERQLQNAELDLAAAQRNLAEGGSASGDAVQDALFNLASANLSLERDLASAPWTNVVNARESVERSQRALENAQREYDNAVSRPDTSASTIDSLYEGLIQARENLDQAQRSYHDAAASYYQYELGLEGTRNSVLQAELALEAARQGGGDPDLVDSLVRAQLEVDNIRQQIAQSTLFAPFDGVVLEITASAGDQVEAFAGIITLALPEPKEAIASLSFNEIQNLQVGQIGICEEVNRPESAVQCVVRQLPLSNNDVDQTVRIAATLPDVQQGALIDITMILQERLDVLYLPPQAINEFGNRTFVVLQTPDGERVRDVTLGLRTNERVEIVEGVAAGDVIVQQ